MSEDMKLNDAALQRAGNRLVEATLGITTGAVRRPPTPATLSGLSGEIDLYLRGLVVARAALGDAAKAASIAAAALMAESAALDADIAQSLPSGFVMGQVTK